MKRRRIGGQKTAMRKMVIMVASRAPRKRFRGQEIRKTSKMPMMKVITEEMVSKSGRARPRLRSRTERIIIAIATATPVGKEYLTM